MKKFSLVHQTIRYDAGREEHGGGHNGPAQIGSLLEVRTLKPCVPQRKAREPAYHVSTRAAVLKLEENPH
jgi:hypothetical protein